MLCNSCPSTIPAGTGPVIQRESNIGVKDASFRRKGSAYGGKSAFDLRHGDSRFIFLE